MRALALFVLLPTVVLAASFGGSGGGGGTCGVNMSCVAESFTATATSGTAFAVTSQLTCAVDLGPGALDCLGTDGSGFVTLPDGAVLKVGDTVLQNAQVTIVNGYLTLSNSAIRRLAGDAVPIEGGARSVAAALGACNAGNEWTLKADSASGASTSHRSRLCLCTSDGAGTPAYAWQNAVSGTVGTDTTCSD
jgi:hypothetical protein